MPYPKARPRPKNEKSRNEVDNSSLENPKAKQPRPTNEKLKKSRNGGIQSLQKIENVKLPIDQKMVKEGTFHKPFSEDTEKIFQSKKVLIYFGFGTQTQLLN